MLYYQLIRIFQILFRALDMYITNLKTIGGFRGLLNESCKVMILNALY